MSKTIWDKSKLIQVGVGQDVARELLLSRGVKESEIPDYIAPDYNKILNNYSQLPDIQKAVERITDAVRKNQKIIIYGDYDIDGLTATALLYDVLKQAGADLDIYIPDRFEEGYGLNTEALLGLKEAGTDLVVTVDCGTTAYEQVQESCKVGLDIVITDHHEPGAGAPSGCIACVNPKLSNKKNLNDLAGVGVAFYLALAIQNKLGVPAQGQEKWLLDLVALGTICDIVPLVGDNRILASFGLKVIQKTKRAGLLALIEKAGIDWSSGVSETDLGFKLGPRLNAAGRLAHAKIALELLTTDDMDLARDHASELDLLNHRRQEETKEIFAQAGKQAKQYNRQPILVLSDPSWSHGIVGIVASRIAEKFNKPAILIQELGGLSKGSARSYNSFNIIDAIAACSDSLERFGGHSFAAGVSLQTENIDQFRYRINEYAIANMDVKNNFRTISIDLGLDRRSPELEIYDDINRLAPFGNSNRRPCILSAVEVKQVRLVGSDATHLRLIVVDSFGKQHSAIGFGMASNWPWLEEGVEIELVYELTENIWNDTRSHQLEIIDIRNKKNT